MSLFVLEWLGMSLHSVPSFSTASWYISVLFHIFRGKYSANRAEYKMKARFYFIPEVQPILFKYSANRAEYKMKACTESDIILFAIGQCF